MFLSLPGWLIFPTSQATSLGLLFSHPTLNLSANPVSVIVLLVVLFSYCCSYAGPDHHSLKLDSAWVSSLDSLLPQLDVLSPSPHTSKSKSDLIALTRFASYPWTCTQPTLWLHFLPLLQLTPQPQPNSLLSSYLNMSSSLPHQALGLALPSAQIPMELSPLLPSDHFLFVTPFLVLPWPASLAWDHYLLLSLSCLFFFLSTYHYLTYSSCLSAFCLIRKSAQPEQEL